MKSAELRQRHPRITFTRAEHHFADSDLTVTAHFLLDPDIKFTSRVTIHGVNSDQYHSLSSEELANYTFHLGLAEIFSYWKAAVPPEILVTAGSLTPDQAKFWHELLIKGMGEFFYVNQLDFTAPDFVKISSVPREEVANTRQSTQTHPAPLSGCLLPLGGGKDSLVALEILKQRTAEPVTLFALNPVAAVLETAKLHPDLLLITASREIDPALLRLNQEGYLNGHTPFSAYLAFLATFVARIFGQKYVVISNERSSNEESVLYLDHPVNHQYSKSYELEKNFHHYAAKYLPQPGPVYFSLLRPLYELQIAQLFSEMPQYFSIFKSCNRGQKQNRWCGECSKCLFAFLILYPFLGEKIMTDIFGINLLTNDTLWPIAKELIGYSHQKPLDCVGTHEESLIALYLSYQKDQQDNKQLSKLSKRFATEVLPRESNLEERTEAILAAWNSHHSLPDQFARIMEYVHQSTFSPRA